MKGNKSSIRKINIAIIALSLLAISIEVVRGNYPWELKEGVVFSKGQIFLNQFPPQDFPIFCSGIKTPDTIKN